VFSLDGAVLGPAVSPDLHGLSGCESGHGADDAGELSDVHFAADATAAYYLLAFGASLLAATIESSSGPRTSMGTRAVRSAWSQYQ
jgi:hypothetical protein